MSGGDLPLFTPLKTLVYDANARLASSVINYI